MSNAKNKTTTTTSPFRGDCLKGQVAVVTGGGSGIGLEISRQLLLHGCAAVIICGRRRAFLQRAVVWLQEQVKDRASTNPRVEYQACDVRKPEDCANVMRFVKEQFDRLDLLVNGAAGNFLATAADLTPKGFATVMAIDAMGTFHMSHAAHALLSATHQRTGTTSVIVNISATLQYGATWWQAHASAAKAAVDSLTRSLALEWGSHHIRVVGIAPGPIANTPGTSKLAPGLDGSKVAAAVTQGIPLQRMGQASEIGQAVVYLCTAQYVTGATLVVDGGQWLYRPPLVPEQLVAQLSRKVEASSRAQGAGGTAAPQRSSL